MANRTQTYTDAQLRRLERLIVSRNAEFSEHHEEVQLFRARLERQATEGPSKAVFAWGDHVIWIVDAKFQTPNGEKTREVVSRDSGVIVIPVDSDGKLLFVNQFREPARRYSLEFPGGGIPRDGEPSATAKKEFLEESGYSIVGQPLPLFYSYPHIYSAPEVHYYYLANVSNAAAVSQQLDETEIIAKGVVRLTLGEAKAAIYNREIIHAPTITGIYAYSDLKELESLAKVTSRA